MLPKYNSQVSRETLISLGFSKLVQEFDDHEASREGLGFRILEPKVISKHFEDVGLDPEIANHNEISGLSGGQKVKVVLAGAMWNNPHLLVLDEPTNFLDRDSLGGLAVAIRDYKGGVVMISHNEEFVGALCPEQWHVADGRVTHKGHLAISMDRFDDSSRPGSSVASSNVSSAAPSAAASAANSEAEGKDGDMKFRARKKKKLTRAQLKEREVRRRLRHIEWLNSPKASKLCVPVHNLDSTLILTIDRVPHTHQTRMTRHRGYAFMVWRMSPRDGSHHVAFPGVRIDGSTR
jgi:elongation factor 3